MQDIKEVNPSRAISRLVKISKNGKGVEKINIAQEQNEAVMDTLDKVVSTLLAINVTI